MLDGVFEQQKKVGKQGEEVVLNYLLTKHIVQDVREDKEYQDRDIDFLVDGHSLEIKTDNNIARTGNVYLETYKGGWFYKCDAEYLGVYSPQTNTLNIFLLSALKSLLPSFGREIKHYDRDTGLMVPAVLISVCDAKNKGALTQTISL